MRRAFSYLCVCVYIFTSMISEINFSFSIQLFAVGLSMCVCVCAYINRMAISGCGNQVPLGLEWRFAVAVVLRQCRPAFHDAGDENKSTAGTDTTAR